MDEKLEAIKNTLVFLLDDYKSTSLENFEEISSLKNDLMDAFTTENG